jgi:death-on-curing family protein
MPVVPPDIDAVLRLKRESMKGTTGLAVERDSDRGCIDGAIGAAMHAAYYTSDNGTIDAIHVAAYLLYYIVSKHCLADGNKRTAWLTSVDFLLSHGLVVCATDDDVFHFVSNVADNSLSRDQVLEWYVADGRLEAFTDVATRPYGSNGNHTP